MKNSVLCYLEKSAKDYSDKVAFFDEKNEITFGKLRKRSIAVSQLIKENVSGRRNPILTYLPKSVENIVGFMGILYSGNFYTPTDVKFPAEKVKSVIDALQPKAVLANTQTIEKIKEICADRSITVINMDMADFGIEYSFEVSEQMVEEILDVDPVYTFFTSGSTGTPKGVIINNRNIIDYTDWAVRTFSIDDKTIMGNQSPLYFDISTQDIYTTLKSGATLGIIPPMYFAFPVKVLQYINDRNINFLYWVPSAFVSIANYDLLTRVKIDNVHTMMFGGEVMPTKQLNYWIENLPNIKTIANVYGPTEATVNCTYYIVDRKFDDTDVLPLGKACENTGLLVVDENMKLIDKSQANVMGELCVYGSSLSSGYWGDLEKTKEKYINNPYNPYYEEKMYLTGDLVFYNELGELVYSGRKDFQIKHLGYRIELGEIEAVASGKDGIDVVCVGYDKDNKQIVLFYQGNSEICDVRGYIESVLPKYMTPSEYIKLKRIPYNDNGKIDRKQIMLNYKESIEC